MRRRYRIALLFCATSLLVASARRSVVVAGEIEEISSKIRSQTINADSIPATLSAQPATVLEPRDQETTETQTQGAQEYINASEQVSVFGIEMRVDVRKAEREIQGLLVIDVQSTAEAIPLHERDDLIIAVDSTRVTNFADLCEQMRLVRPGEIIYLTVLREGHRVQVPIQVRSAMPPVQDWVR